jgi:hypothetical protein
MLELRPTEKFSWSFNISQDGAPLGVLELTRFASKGSFTLGNEKYEVARERFMGPFLLKHGDRIAARAEREGLLAAKYDIVAEDRQLLLRSKWFRKAELLHGDVVAARLERPNILSRTVRIEVINNISTPVIVFASAIMILLWRRRSRSNN